MCKNSVGNLLGHISTSFNFGSTHRKAAQNISRLRFMKIKLISYPFDSVEIYGVFDYPHFFSQRDEVGPYFVMSLLFIFN